MNKNDLVILGLLMEKPKHGYEIMQDIKQRGFEHWANINIASSYNHLNSLEEKSAIKSTTEKVGNMPERKVFTITDKGKEYLSDQVIEAMKGKGVVEDLLSLGVAFIYGAKRDEVIEALKGRLELFNTVKDQIEKTFQGEKRQIPYNWKLLMRKTIEHFNVEIKYYRELLSEVKKKDFFKNK